MNEIFLFKDLYLSLKLKSFEFENFYCKNSYLFLYFTNINLKRKLIKIDEILIITINNLKFIKF